MASLPSTMRAVVVRRHGGPEVLNIEDVPVPSPGAGEALIRVRACALNNMDIWARSGPPGGRPIFPWRERAFPFTSGGDVAGTVETLGAGVQDWVRGDRVVVNPILSCGDCEFCLAGEQTMCLHYRIFGEHTPGGLAEYVVAPARNLLRLPDHVPFEKAAVPAAYCTAWRMMITAGGLRAGEDVLIVGASGGVGTAALLIARMAGARRIFAVVTGAEKARKAAEAGAIPIDRAVTPNFSEHVLEATEGAGVHLAADPVGAPTWPQTIRSLRRGGRMTICGASGGERPDFDIREVYQRHRRIIGAPMGNVSDLGAVMGAIFSGAIDPILHAVLPLDRIREAHRLMEAREHFGKVVMVPPTG
ncbi:MAG: alcohol dehydrogenase catalytic domain-containing protein [Armatimonadota bacterium]|nr:alcohol dehydrogenase catalytic domain-containing protein [Armatimonadota bacterium]